MTLHFTKMHGLGNDFMVIDGINQSIHLNSADISKLSPCNTGIGFDQCLIVEKSDIQGIDFFYRIFNANGQEVAQCGNGARCLARFIHHYKLSNKPVITVATHTTRMQLKINTDKTVTVEMPTPQFNPTTIPLQMPVEKPIYTILGKGNEQYDVHALSVGNPHAVLLVTNTDNSPVDKVGKHISEHSLFTEQTNVGFMQVVTPEYIRLRVYERGCGETHACGSGAVAAVAAGRRYHHLVETVTVGLPGGELVVHWPDMHGPIYLTGPAAFVYEGVLIQDL